jgi:hypothetical protein
LLDGIIFVFAFYETLDLRCRGEHNSQMKKHQWVKEFVGAVTVCDPKGIILEMNDQGVKMFKG